MIEETDFKVEFTFKNGKEKTVIMTASDVDTMFDKLWEREPIKWMNIWEDIINLGDVSYINYDEVTEDSIR